MLIITGIGKLDIERHAFEAKLEALSMFMQLIIMIYGFEWIQ